MRVERGFNETMIKFFAPVRVLPFQYLKIAVRTIAKAIYPIATIWVIDQVLGLIALQDYEQAKNRAIWYWIYVVIYNIFLIWISIYRDQDVQWNTRKVLNDIYMKKFIQLDVNSVERIWTGKLIAILDSWLARWRMLLRSVFRSWIESVITIALSMVYIALEIWNEIVWILWALLILILFINKMNDYAIIWRNRRRDKIHEHTQSFVRIIMSKIEILQANKWAREIARLNIIMEEIRKIHRKVTLYVRMFFRIPMLSVSIWIWVALYLAASPERIQFSDIWWIAWVLMILNHLWTVLNNWVSFFREFTKDIIHVEKILDLFEHTPKIIWYEEWEMFTYSHWDIHLDAVSFSYNQTEESEEHSNDIINEFSLSITWEQKTALVWISWSGKSTLIKLIAWYLRPDKWNIFVDKQNLTDVSLKSYFKHIGYLTQDPSVFDGTILDNLTYASEWEVDKDQLEKCISLSKCDFIRDFLDGLETEIGERWIRLSWWQRQRLAIAKIFLKDPEIIILDEPTSALDSFSEEAITQAMNNLFKDRTVIIIAHRLQTVKNADDIIVIDEWKVIERGTHSDLVALWWSYAKMLELQSWF